jgi:two-component system, cell cycle sensor histidine kinase and response regulator CckA
VTQGKSLSTPALNTSAAAQLAAIVESSVDAIVSKRLDGTVLSWNKAAERIFGYSAEEMVGGSIYRLIPPELHDEEATILSRAARGEQIAHYETTRIRKDGNRITISLTVSPVLDHDGRIAGVASIKRDITESKRLEQTLRQAAKMESIGRLAGGLAHDFNNHLHALSGFAHLISRDPHLSPSSRQDLLQIQKVSERMATLTHQLLAFARQQVLTPETVDLSAIVTDAHSMLKRLIGSNYDLELDQTYGTRWVRVDRGQLVQVLMNLVTNARDAMPSGGRVQVRTYTREVGPHQLVDMMKSEIPAGAYAVLDVVDEGSGIAPADLPRLFEPFFTTKEIGRGTGLGLATVEGIVSQSSGSIQIETEMGKGTTFRVLLPLSTPVLIEDNRSRAEQNSAGARGRILIVDDEENVRVVVGRLVQMEGYEIILASNGKEALEILAQTGGAIDLVITDVVMPVMGGRELVDRLALQHPDIPLIWMSGHPRGDGPEGEPSENQPFLQKPIAPEALLEAVRKTIRSPA